MTTNRSGVQNDPLAQGTISLGRTDLVIFDCDGVIADSEVISLKTLYQTLQDHHVPMSEDEVMARFLGRSLRTILDTVARKAPAASLTDLAADWESTLFAEFRRSLRPIPSIVALLDHLAAQAVPYCIASSGTHERIGIALQAMGLTDRFAHIFSAEDVTRGKPAPDLFLLAANTLGADPAHCLVVEDSPYGAEAAKEAGMPCAGFVGGSHLAGFADAHGKRLLEHGATFVISTHQTLMSHGLGQGAS